HMLTSLAEHYGFDIEKPWKKLAKKYRELVLYGSKDEVIDFSYVNDRGDTYKRAHTFEGVIPNMERRYRDTESSSIREELAKYLSSMKCPQCEGTRLKKDARHVFVDNRTLP